MLSKIFGGGDDRAKAQASVTRQLRMLAGQSGRSADEIGALAGVPGNDVRKLLDPATALLPVDVLVALTPHVVDPHTALDPETMTFVNASVPAGNAANAAPRGNPANSHHIVKDKKMRILATLVKPVSSDATITQHQIKAASDAAAMSTLSQSVARPDERMEFTPAPGEPGMVRTLDAAAYWRLLLRKIEDNAEADAAMLALKDKFPASDLGQSFLELGRAEVRKLVMFHANSTRSGRWLAEHMDTVALWLMRTKAADEGAFALSNDLVAPAYSAVAAAMQRKHTLTVPTSEAALVVAARCHLAA